MRGAEHSAQQAQRARHASVREVTHNEIGAAATARQYGAEGCGGTSPPAAAVPPQPNPSPYARKVIPDEERARRYEAWHAGRRAGKSIAEIARRAGVVTEEFRRWLERERENTERAARVAKYKWRPCLRCRREFQSEGRGNRMCGPCRQYAPTCDSPFTPDPGGGSGRQVWARRS